MTMDAYSYLFHTTPECFILIGQEMVFNVLVNYSSSSESSSIVTTWTGSCTMDTRHKRVKKYADMVKIPVRRCEGASDVRIVYKFHPEKVLIKFAVAY